MSTPTSFYVQKPCDQYWSTGLRPCVIEAGPVDISESDLTEWQKTDEFVEEHLKVIHPNNLGWKYVDKTLWTECSGPSRELDFKQYVELYHSLKPKRPLPTGWKEHKANK